MALLKHALSLSSINKHVCHILATSNQTRLKTSKMSNPQMPHARLVTAVLVKSRLQPSHQRIKLSILFFPIDWLDLGTAG